ncbi:MAG: [FeFe] hydrogenase maturase subunit HydE [Synergistaceae bacterium]|nr:[FeFe] hydrogenase H-cluster radical SAM maturase HydE [Synergistaceae bacterium]
MTETVTHTYNGTSDPADDVGKNIVKFKSGGMHKKDADAFVLVDKLEKQRCLSKDELVYLVSSYTSDLSEYLFEKARNISKRYYGNHVYIRGLVEFTNFCKNDCLYCGIRKSNLSASRYRLTEDQIFQACETGYELGFRTFVLQGGEDPYFSDDKIIYIVKNIKTRYPDCAVTLSIGEKTRESYQAYFDAGADRYLLRHETANQEHYSMLHPAEMSLTNRKRCLADLKEIGYQVGSGFMVGSPFQTAEYLADDMLFLYELQPHMVGIGPFVPHHSTQFANFSSGSAELTVFIIGLLRLMLPSALIPSTTALGTIDPRGRELGILAGANVVMPNLSPVDVRNKYLLYDNKICTGDEAAECRFCMQRRIESIGYEIAVTKGDFIPMSS